MIPSDTVVARATPQGMGGVAVIRLSGDKALEIAIKLTGIKAFKPRVATLSRFYQKDKTCLDEGLVLFFPAPNSYTGEDVIECQLHGSEVVVAELLNVCLHFGARMARPGEFTERAFHHGKIDLIQATAVCDLIQARSKRAAKAALQSLQGRFSERVKGVQDVLMTTRMYVESSIDFSEEEVDLLTDQAFLKHLNDLNDRLTKLLKQAESGRVLNQGLRLAIIGPTNAGKSSLMNWLTQLDTSIVTSVPGTTRDVIKEQVVLSGIPVTLLDTAGLRYTKDPVEKIGIERVRVEVMNADLIWLVMAYDTNQPSDAESFWQEYFPSVPFPFDRINVIMNKVDLIKPQPDILSISVKENRGKDRLLATLTHDLIFSDQDVISVRVEQLAALRRAQQHVLQAREPIQNHQLDIAAEELKAAQQQLSILTGEVTQEDVLSQIFSTFCIGK